jgi:hypothetical protein
MAWRSDKGKPYNLLEAINNKSLFFVGLKNLFPV